MWESRMQGNLPVRFGGGWAETCAVKAQRAALPPYAITYLRNGGDVLTLQALLGHADLKMVKRYAQVAAADCERVHQAASPVDNWKL